MNTAIAPSTRQGGVMLLETMIAILIFSLGVLSIVQLHAVSVKQSTDAEFRSIAAQLASDLVSRMWATDRKQTTLQTQFASDTGAAFTTWRDTTIKAAGLPLPTETRYQPQVTIIPDPDVTGATRAIITLYWRAPGEKVDANGKPVDAPHSYVTTVTLR